jgi:FtsH-binding integral membrane protein
MNNYYGNSWAENARPSEHLPVSVVNDFLQRVFIIMAFGLAITGLVSYYCFSLFFSTQETAYQVTRSGTLFLRPEYAFLFMGFTKYIVMFAPLAFVLAISFGISRMSYAVATLVFIAFAGVMGLSLSSIFAIYTTGSIALTFFVTAGTFGAMALYGITTKADLSKLGSILMMALFGIIIAGLVNMFVKSSMFDMIISIIGVLVFTGLTAYDVQRIMRESLTMDAGSEEAKKASVLGALTLYLDFINLFLYLLKFLGSRRD